MFLITRFRTSTAANTRELIAAFTVSAHNKSSQYDSAGLLHPLPIPHRPWSHVAVDLITGLPPSKDNNTILIIVDRFLKAVHFVPLPTLLTALLTC